MNIKRSSQLQSQELSTPLPLGAILLAIGVNTDTSNQLINVSKRTWSTRLQSRVYQIDQYHRTRSTRLQSRDLSTPQPGSDLISYQLQYRHWQSIDQCLKKDMIYTATIPWLSNRSIPILKVWSLSVCFNETQITLHCKQSGVLDITNFIKIHV